MTDPQIILSEKRARIEGLELVLAAECEQLKGMEMMVAHFNGVAATRAPLDSIKLASTPSVGGRQPGSISKRWRKVLWANDLGCGTFEISDLVLAVRQLEGRPLRPADAKRQMETYVELGFVTGSADAGYVVTDEFRSKFADDAPDSFNENGEPNGNAAGSPDAGRVTALPYDDPDDL